VTAARPVPVRSLFEAYAPVADVGHLAMLDEPPPADAAVVPWPEWRAGRSSYPGIAPSPENASRASSSVVSAAGRTWSDVTISPSGTAAPCSRT
jgi:hypothetical protein